MVIERFLSLASSAIIGRELGPADYGQYAYLVAMVGWLVRGGNHGLPTSAIKFVAEQVGAGSTGKIGSIVRQLRRWQLGSSMGAIAVASVWLYVYLPGSKGSSLHVLAAVGLLISLAARLDAGFQSSLAKGYGRFQVESTCQLSAALVVVAGAALIASRAGDLAQFILLYTIGSIACFAVARFGMRGLAPRDSTDMVTALEQQRLRSHVRSTAMLILIGIASSGMVEIVLLGHWHDSDVVGFFSIGLMLSKGLTSLAVSGLAAVLLPTLSTTFGRQNSLAYTELLERANRFYWSIGFAVAAYGVAVTDPVVAFMYGPHFDRAKDVTAWMFVINGSMAFSGTLFALFASSNRQSVRIRPAVVALTLQCLVAIVTVKYFGLYGALLSYAVGSTVNVAILWAYAVKTGEMRPQIGRCVRTAIAAILAGTASIAAGGSFSGAAKLFVMTAGFPIFWVIGLIALRCIAPSDLWPVEKYLQRLPARLAHPGMTMLAWVLRWLSEEK